MAKTLDFFLLFFSLGDLSKDGGGGGGDGASLINASAVTVLLNVPVIAIFVVATVADDENT